MKRKLIIIILIITLVALLAGGGILLRKVSIQRQEYIDELMQMELPDIVFSHRYEDKGWNPSYYYNCIIDRNGNVYYTENPEASYVIYHSEGSAEFDENWTIIDHVDEIELREQYVIFLELMNMPDYKKIPEYESSGIDEMLDIYWNGFYLEDGKRVQYEFFTYPKDVYYIITDERGVELAEWLSEQTGLRKYIRDSVFK